MKDVSDKVVNLSITSEEIIALYILSNVLFDDLRKMHQIHEFLHKASPTASALTQDGGGDDIDKQSDKDGAKEDCKNKRKRADDDEPNPSGCMIEFYS